MLEKTVRLTQEIKEWLCLLWAWIAQQFTPNPDELRERGFVYALTHLANGGTKEQLEAEAANPFDHNQFDIGIIEGVLYWESVKDMQK